MRASASHQLAWLAVLASLLGGFHARDIGGNVAGIDYRSRTQPYVNLIRQAQPFYSLINASAPALLDEHGWPTEDFSVYLQTQGANLAGDYRISFSGKGVVSSRRDGTITAQRYDPTTNTVQATLAVVDPNATDLALNVSQTRGGATNMSVLLPGFTDAQAEDINPLYVKQLEPFSILRYLSVLPVGRDFPTEWSQRATPSNSPSWSGFCCPLLRNDSSLPWEKLVEFANTVGHADVWLPLVVTVNDDYYTQLAKLLKAQLRTNISIYFEYGNEMWNGHFPSEWRVAEMANASVTQHGDPYHLNYDGVGDATTWGHRLVGYTATVRLPKLFAAVFGADSVGPDKRVRPLLGAQSDDPKYIEGVLQYLRDTQEGGIQRLHAIHTSYYFSSHNASDTMSEGEVLRELNASLYAQLPDPRTSHAGHTAVAGWFGVPKVLGYESGPGTFGGNSLPAKVAANRNQLVGDMLGSMFDIWDAYGFEELCFFHAGVTLYDWPYGQWSPAETYGVDTPKLRALAAARAKPKQTATIGTPVPFTNHSAGLHIGYYAAPGKAPDPILHYILTNSTYRYLVRSPAAGERHLTLHTSTTNASFTDCRIQVGLSFAGLERPTLQDVALPPTANHNAFAPTAPLKLSLPAGVAVLELKAIGPSCTHIAKNRTLSDYEVAAIDLE